MSDDFPNFPSLYESGVVVVLKNALFIEKNKGRTTHESSLVPRKKSCSARRICKLQSTGKLALQYASPHRLVTIFRKNGMSVGNDCKIRKDLFWYSRNLLT